MRATSAFTFALVAMLSLYTLDAAAVPSLEHPVTDLAGELSPDDENAIAQRIVAHRNATSVQIAVLVVQTTEGVPIDDYSMQVAQQWRGGHAERNNGVLITFAVRDRRSRIEVGYGLEASLPDSRTRAILDGLRPDLRARNLAAASMHAVEAVIGYTNGSAPTAIAADPSALPSIAAPSSEVTFPTLHYEAPLAPPPAATLYQTRESEGDFGFFFVMFIAVLVVAGLGVLFWALNAAGGGGGGGTYSSSGGSWTSDPGSTWMGSSSNNSSSFWSSSSSSSSSYDSSSSSSYDSSSSSSSDNSSSGSGDGGSFGGGGASSDW